jgi:hypothetical protein
MSFYIFHTNILLGHIRIETLGFSDNNNNNNNKVIICSDFCAIDFGWDFTFL